MCPAEGSTAPFLICHSNKKKTNSIQFVYAAQTKSFGRLPPNGIHIFIWSEAASICTRWKIINTHTQCKTNFLLLLWLAAVPCVFAVTIKSKMELNKYILFEGATYIRVWNIFITECMASMMNMHWPDTDMPQYKCIRQTQHTQCTYHMSVRANNIHICNLFHRKEHQ